jgi:hypothetical protein
VGGTAPATVSPCHLGLIVRRDAVVPTALLTLARNHGCALTLISFSVNLVLLWVALGRASLVGRAVGEAGARAVAKVFGLLPAAIRVTLIRRLDLALCAVQAGFCCRAELSHNVLSF